MKVQQAAKAGSPTHVLGKLTMAEASTAWGTHYAQRLQHGCQRRNRLIGQTIDSTASEVAELFAELDDAARLGVSATAARVADEAADVWYGAHCYAVAYTEQVQRVLTGWTHNMQASGGDTRVSNQRSPPTPGEDEARTQAHHAPVADDHKIFKNIILVSKNSTPIVDLRSPDPDASFDVKTFGKASEHPKCEEKAMGDAVDYEVVYKAAGDAKNAVPSTAAGRQRSIREWLRQPAAQTEAAHTVVQRKIIPLPSLVDAVWVDGIPT